MIRAETDMHVFTLSGEHESFKVFLSTERLQEGLNVVRLRLEAEEAVTPPTLTLRWSHPARDIQASWHPAQDRNKSFKADWIRGIRSNAATSAPVYSLFNAAGRNRLTFAISDALNTVHYAGGISEETAEFHLKVQLFGETTAPFREYEASLLMDTRDIPMLNYWLTFWRNNRQMLLEGKLEPMNPELLYPFVRATKGRKGIAVAYHDAIAPLLAASPRSGGQAGEGSLCGYIQL
jgi:hypothetical protein